MLIFQGVPGYPSNKIPHTASWNPPEVPIRIINSFGSYIEPIPQKEVCFSIYIPYIVNFPQLWKDPSEKKQTNTSKINHSPTWILRCDVAAGDSQPQQMRFRPTWDGHLYPGDKRDRDRLEELEADSESSPGFFTNSFDIVDGWNYLPFFRGCLWYITWVFGGQNLCFSCGFLVEP